MESANKGVHPVWRTLGLTALGLLLFGGGVAAGAVASGRVTAANRTVVAQPRAAVPMIPRNAPDIRGGGKEGPDVQKPDDRNGRRSGQPNYDNPMPFGPNLMPGKPNDVPPDGFVMPGPFGNGRIEMFGFDEKGEVVPDKNLVPAEGQTLTLDNAIKVADAYLKNRGDGDLKVSNVIEFEKHFYAVITEKDSGRGAFALIINPKTAAVSYEPGPSVFWNLKYGMMGRSTRLATPGDPFEDVDGKSMTVSASQAKDFAQAKLDASAAGRTVEGDGLAYYGFYTFEYSEDGKTFGLVSVNGYTGSVWLHDWNGAFVSEKEIQ